MLLRAYRITDRLGLVILKISAGFSGALLDGAQILLGSGAGIVGKFFARLAGIFLAIVLFFWSIVRVVWRIIGRFFAALLGLLGIATTRTARVGGRATGQAVRSAHGVASDAMARQAARAEMEVGLAEDPLRAQNRALSGLVVAALAALVIAVIWATSQPNKAPFNATINDTNANLSASNTTVVPTVPGGVLLATPVPTATQLPEVLQVRGSLAFVAREGAQQDIWAVSVGGTNAIRLTNDPSDERDPSWSPDGQRLAYASHKDGNWEIYIQTMAAGEPARMTYDLSFQANPVWSPDAAYLAYESYLGDNLDIYVMSLIDTTTPPRPLPSSTTAAEFSPAWSPDGRRIAYTSWQDGNQELYVFSLDTLEAINLTNTPDRNEDYAAWSPNGNLVAYSAVDGGIEKVFIKTVDDPTAAAQVFRGGRMPFWSPDGNSLVYVVDSFEGTQFIVEPYQSEGVATPITAVPLPALDPAWTTATLPTALVNAGGLPLAVSEPLYREQFSTADARPLYRLAAINNVTGLQSPFLGDRVDDSFSALR
ncbi:MAG: PD40 domain-containing protein, partial [Chitinophagaceae bacterium]|nr:PD40 domain-containing protein [Anaerolineae bacterium]